MQHFIGIDIGTTVSKGVILDNQGVIIYSYQIIHNYSDYDDYADAWWNEVIQIVKELSTHIIDKSTICNITISAMVPNLVFLDSNGNIALETKLYIDDFALEEQIKLDKIDGTKWKNETLSKLIVLKENEQNWKNVSHVLTTHCYIGFKFTGVRYCDYASAYEYGHIFSDSGKKWNESLLNIHNISYNIFPPLVSSISNIGIMKDDIADLLKLPRGIKIIAGTHDSVASMIGAGLVNNGDNLLYYGTFNCSAVIHADIIDILLGNLSSPPIEWTSSIPDSGPQFTTMCKLFIGSDDYYQFDKLASSSQAGARGVVFLQNPNLLNTSICSIADGAFFHISNTTDIADLCRAVYEAFPYGVLAFWKNNTSFTFPKYCFASGGGVRSNFRVQIVSDILSVKQYKLYNSENAVGTALIGVAAENQSLFFKLQSLRRKDAEIFKPDLTNSNIYKLMAEEYWTLLVK